MNSLAIFILVFMLSGIRSSEIQHGKVETWTNPKDGMVYVPVRAGTIVVQVEDGKTPNEELPFQELTIDDFWMSSTEVTVEQFRKFVESTGYRTEAEVAEDRWNWKNPGFVQGEDHPVVYIGFEDAKAYVKWAGVDLPDEAEWLYACYANTSTRYYWGDEMNSELFWHRENSIEGTHQVATNVPNPWGLYDMIGNVKEYCKIAGGGFVLPGESWTRCVSYKNKTGTIADQMIANSIAKLLHIHPPDPRFVPFRCDDDRGIRCVLRNRNDN